MAIRDGYLEACCVWLLIGHGRRLGPSNSSERAHVMEMVSAGKFSKNTLFCGDAGFVGYRPPNPDKKPLGDPQLRKLTAAEMKKPGELTEKLAA